MVELREHQEGISDLKTQVTINNTIKLKKRISRLVSSFDGRDRNNRNRRSFSSVERKSERRESKKEDLTCLGPKGTHCCLSGFSLFSGGNDGRCSRQREIESSEICIEGSLQWTGDKGQRTKGIVCLCLSLTRNPPTRQLDGRGKFCEPNMYP